MKRNIIFVIKIFSSTSLNLWARTQLAYKYNGNKILFIIIFFQCYYVYTRRGKTNISWMYYITLIMKNHEVKKSSAAATLFFFFLVP